MSKDPVCGMPGREGFRYEYKGSIFYFCSSLCREQFKKYSDRYVKKTGKSSSVGRVAGDRKIAYFSMEVGIDAGIPTYSGGLGVLAGDTIKSCADLRVPIVAVSLLYEKGYFCQKLDARGNQQELTVQWDPRDFLTLLPGKVKVRIENRAVAIRAWQYDVSGISGYSVPILFLDTDLKENSEYDRSLNDYLYGGDDKYRLAQEIILGIGGVRMLNGLGFTEIKRYHMNEGHAAFLTLELLNERKREKEPVWDFETVREMCVFTTHTPVPAGHDQFSHDLVKDVLGELVPFDILKMLGGMPWVFPRTKFGVHTWTRRKRLSTTSTKRQARDLGMMY